jgi:malate synthase
VADVRVQGPPVERGEEILTPEALEFVADLQTRFGPHRDALLAGRRLDDARRLFEQVAPADEFPDFPTLPAYELIDRP